MSVFKLDGNYTYLQDMYNYTVALQSSRVSLESLILLNSKIIVDIIKIISEKLKIKVLYNFNFNYNQLSRKLNILNVQYKYEWIDEISEKNWYIQEEEYVNDIKKLMITHI